MTVLNLIQLNFETGGYNFLVRALINGKPALLLLDTGSARTVLDSDRMQKFVEKTELKRVTRKHLSPHATSIFSHVADIARLEIGSVVIENYKTTAADLSHINRSFRGLGNPQIDGLLGCDILRHCKAVLRFDDRVLELDDLVEPTVSPTNSFTE
ncbi:MAG: aspartyl protease family protein [Lentimicrobium sp.]|jgi:hypothetical protein|nr:aspartyl protease family protein [Lentimicrobium sp.]HAH57018.1 hypothetical protein [Bacteroidales bacterium]